MRVGSTKSPSGPQFWQRGIDKRLDYERETFFAVVTAVYSDTTYDVAVGSGLSECAQYYDVGNGTPYYFAVGDRVIVGRVSGGRGNRHVILSPAGWSGVASPSGGGSGGGSSPSGSESLSEVIDARDSDVYGSLSTLDARLEAGDAEVYDARQGYASLSDRLTAKADLSSPQFEGTPRAEKYEVHDGAKYITWDDGDLTFTDDNAGTKSLSELAAGGGGGVGLADTDPKEPRVPPQAGTAEEASRSDHQHPDLRWLCEQMLERVLSLQLDTKDATKYDVTYSFTSAADANRGIATWNGSWGVYASSCASNTTGNYFELTFVGDGITLWVFTNHGAGASTTAHTVLLDGVSQAAWNQHTDASYLLSGLSYGVHTIRVTVVGAVTLSIGEAVPHQLHYNASGGAGDAAEILHVEPWLYLTTIGIANTNNGAGFPDLRYGENIITRLPLQTAWGNSRVALRNPLDTGPLPATFGFVRLPLEFPASQGLPLAGHTVTLGSTAATRGFRPQNETGILIVTWQAMCRALDTAVIHQSFLPFIGRVTAVGAGSALSVGELVLGICCYADASAQAASYTLPYNHANCAADFYKIPGSLL